MTKTIIAASLLIMSSLGAFAADIGFLSSSGRVRSYGSAGATDIQTIQDANPIHLASSLNQSQASADFSAAFSGTDFTMTASHFGSRNSPNFAYPESNVTAAIGLTLDQSTLFVLRGSASGANGVVIFVIHDNTRGADVFSVRLFLDSSVVIDRSVLLEPGSYTFYTESGFPYGGDVPLSISAQYNIKATLGFGETQPQIQRTQAGSFLINFATNVGITYQLQTSTDLQAWMDVNAPIAGDSGQKSIPQSTFEPRQFWRLSLSNTPGS